MAISAAVPLTILSRRSDIQCFLQTRYVSASPALRVHLRSRSSAPALTTVVADARRKVDGGAGHVCRLLASVSLGLALAAVGSRNRAVHAATGEIVLSRPAVSATQVQVASLAEKAMYALDYFFATRAAGKAIVLLAVCAILTGVGGVVYHYYGDGRTSGLPECFWTAWTFIADSGAHAGQDTFRKRLIAVPITVGGMFFFALLVGLVTDAVANKVDQLSKGRSRVLEDRHTLIIGWTKKTIPLVKELTVANKGRKAKRNVVVLGNGAHKEEMDNVLQEAVPVPDRFGTKVVTRTGSPGSLESLSLCSASSASTIVLLSPPASSPMEADANVLQTCLLLADLPEVGADIIVELAELDHVNELHAMVRTLLPKRLQRAKSSEWQKIVPVATGDMAMRIMVKQALEPGIAAVGRELMQFEGCEFHLKSWPELSGKTFGEALYLFEDAIPCGLRKSLPSGGSYTLVAPPLDTLIQESDELLVISEDENSYKPGKTNAPLNVPEIKTEREQEKPPVKVLIVGWKNDLNDVLQLIDASVSKGSRVSVLSTADKDVRAEEFEQGLELRNVHLEQIYGDPASMRVLKEMPLETYDKVIILTEEASKSRPGTTAMLIRHIQVERGRTNSTIVAELQTLENGTGLERVQKAWLDEAVDPDYLEAMLLANLAEDVDIGSVLEEVVGRDSGSSLVLRQATSYLKHQDEQLNFWDLQARTSMRGEILVAYKCAAKDGEWVVNPPFKSSSFSWCRGDELLVLARPSS